MKINKAQQRRVASNPRLPLRAARGLWISMLWLVGAFVGPLAGAQQQPAALERQLLEARNELAMNKSLQARPTVTADAKEALQDRAQVLTKKIQDLEKQKLNPAAASAPAKLQTQPSASKGKA